ncbi:HAD family hydrolase [Odoribacter lunatus]|uniref:HAD family hydrolase n=1 Tax=Odoribacter lunatus TaxID=2941335 RepID=UPI00204264EB|nr:HAD family hydrolase [Odoribacter lunatus]
MKRLVIFDLDGTLLNSLEDLRAAANYALKCFGYPGHDLEAYRYFVGNGITKLIERALPTNARATENIMQVRKVFIDYYQAHKTMLTRPYPGICELLYLLRQRGIILAVASNKFHEATCDLIHFYFGDNTFDVVSGQKEGIPAKPHPDMLEHILKVTGVKKEEALYVGDSEVDMHTATNCGIESVGVTWGFRPRKELESSGANHIADQPADIINWLKES